MIHHITFPMLDRKFPKHNTIAMCQHYMENLLANPSTSYEDRRVAIHYILENKDRFTALPVDTADPVVNEMNMKRNGHNVNMQFLDWLWNTYGGGAS